MIGLPGPGAVLKDHKGAFGHLSGRWRASGCRSYPRDYPQYRPSADGVVHPKVRTRCGHFAATVREKGETATGDRRTSPWTRAISLLSLDDLCPGCIHGRKVKQATTFMRAEPSWLQETSGCCLGGTCTGFPGPVHLTPLYLARRRLRINFILRSLNVSFGSERTRWVFIDSHQIFIPFAVTASTKPNAPSAIRRGAALAPCNRNLTPLIRRACPHWP